MASNKKLAEVVKAELKEIKQRREKSRLSHDNLERSLVGLAFSGGANRSSSFCLGFVQALQKIGLWKYVDYLSTTSGGGYIGAYITSALLKEKEPVTKDKQPFWQEGSPGQNAQVKRFIYGGHYLLKPWRLANMYLMGLFFINLAIFSGLLALCAAVAFLWRCLDYEYARTWAKMLGAGSDLNAPFWPFTVFAFAWLIAWCVSLFQRGAEATGKVARYLLLASFFSLLVGAALLIGNGDIAGWSSYASGNNVSLGGEVWGPIVALIVGGLLPFLSPKRLLQSGLNPKQDWERYTFKIATTALLVGMPMLLVGWLARENISGFNTNEYRAVVAGDIQDWPSLAGMLSEPALVELMENPSVEVNEAKRRLVTPKPTDGATADGSAAPKANSSGDTKNSDSEVSRETALRLSLWKAADAMRRDGVHQQAGGATSVHREPSAQLVNGSPSITPENSDGTSPSAGGPEKMQVVAEKMQEVTKQISKDVAKTVEIGAKDLGTVKFESLSAQDQRDFLNGLKLPVEKRGDWQTKVSLYTAPYLAYAAPRLKQRQLAFARAESEFLEKGVWQRSSLATYLLRLFHIASWKFTNDGKAQVYWNETVALDQAKYEFSLALNEVLRHPAFTESYLENTNTGALIAKASNDAKAPSTELTALLTRAVLTDEDSADAKKLATSQAPDEWMPYERHQLARLLLEYDFPTVVRKRTEIRRAVSIYEDQIMRATWFCWSLLAFLIAGMWVDVNSLSLHRYYRNRIAQAFIVPRNVKSPSVPLSDMVTTEYGGPYHLINASVGMIRRGLGEEEAFFASSDDEEDSDQRWVDSFLFSRLYCGSELTDYADTVAYEHSIQGYTHKIDLAEATAISGAALSPGHVQNWLLAFLMVAMNLSLGQWVPNPRIGKPRSRPRVLTLLSSIWKKSSDRPYCFVSDGGHCENLGLVQLLKRRCKLIIAVDAGCDPDHAFHDLGRAIRTARVHGGVRLLELEPDSDGNDQDLSLKPMLRGSGDSGDDRNTQKHFVLGRIRYCNDEEGLLIYVKPCLTGDESADLMQYRQQSPKFPQEPTTDQLFDAAQVEAYRHLGFHTGMELQKLLPRELEVGELWDYPDVDAKLLCEWLTGKGAGIERPDRGVITNPLSASKEAKEAARPIAHQILKKMRQAFRSPADIEGPAFREMLENDLAFANVSPIAAVAALQCSVIDRQQQKAEDREFGIWLLRTIEEDDALLTNTTETLGVLVEATQSTHPEKVRLAAIAVLCILGRGPEHRDFVRESLSKQRTDQRATIRLAVRNALSNLDDSPNMPR